MKIRIFKDGKQHGPYSVEEVTRLIDAGKFAFGDLAWNEKTKKWVALSELLFGQTGTQCQVTSSAVKAGWICLALGFCTFWMMGFGFIFFSVTMILSIFAMCTDQIKHGIALITSAVFGAAACAFLMVVLGIGATGLMLQKAIETAQNSQSQTTFHPASPTFQSVSPQSLPSTVPCGYVARSVTNPPLPTPTNVIQPAPQPLLQPQRQQQHAQWQAQQQQQQASDYQRQMATQAEIRRLQAFQDQELANAAKDRREQEAKRAETERKQKAESSQRDFINRNHFTPGLVESLQRN